MADEQNYAALQALIEPLSQGVNAIAMRPQKTHQLQKTTPYALEDLLATRNQIGSATQDLNNALKARENPWYATMKALGQVKGSPEYGGWLESGLQGLATGRTILDDIKLENAQSLYDARMKDLANRLAVDKMMGETQESTMGYTPIATGKQDGQGSGSGDSISDSGVSGGVVLTGGVSSNYDPVVELAKQKQSFGPLARLEDVANNLGAIGKLANLTGVPKALKTDDDLIKRNVLADDISRLNSARAISLVKGVNSVRIADSDEEKKQLFGPLQDAIQTKNNTEISAVFAATRQRAYSLFKEKARRQGLNPDDVASQEEFNSWWNSFFTNPADVKQAMGVNGKSNAPQSAQPKNTISVGEVRNGYRFKGGDPKKKENWEVAQ